MNINFFAIFFLINVVFAQLDPLATKNRKGNYIQILKKNGKMTNLFPGGIYVRRGQRGNYNYEPYQYTSHFDNRNDQEVFGEWYRGIQGMRNRI